MFKFIRRVNLLRKFLYRIGCFGSKCCQGYKSNKFSVSGTWHALVISRLTELVNRDCVKLFSCASRAEFEKKSSENVDPNVADKVDIIDPSIADKPADDDDVIVPVKFEGDSEAETVILSSQGTEDEEFAVIKAKLPPTKSVVDDDDSDDDHGVEEVEVGESDDSEFCPSPLKKKKEVKKPAPAKPKPGQFLF